MSKNFMISLTNDNITYLLTAFLDISDISRLDIALCNYLDRIKYLECIHSQIFNVDVDIYCGDKFIEWLNQRNLFIETLRIDDVRFTDRSAITISESKLRLKSLFIDKGSSLNLESYKIIIQNSPSLNEIKIAFISNDIVCKIARCCPYLVSFELISSHVTDSPIIELFESCNHLDTLILDECYDITDGCLQVISSSYADRLKSLMISDCEKLTSTAFLSLAKYCVKLLDLNISCNNEIITDDIVIEFAKNSKYLTSLNIWGNNVTNDGIIGLSNHCKCLTNLDISSLPLINNQCIKHILINLLCLEILKANNCVGLKSGLFSEIRKSSVMSLRDIDLSSFTRTENFSNEDIVELFECCPHLCFINISNCNRITDSSIITISSTFNLTFKRFQNQIVFQRMNANLSASQQTVAMKISGCSNIQLI